MLPYNFNSGQCIDVENALGVVANRKKSEIHTFVINSLLIVNFKKKIVSEQFQFFF